MSTTQERLDLVKNPLPFVVVDPLNLVYQIDGELDKIREQMADLQTKRQEALDYAIKNNLMENEKLRIDKKVKSFRTLNVKKFASTFPEEFEMACDLERKEIADKLSHVGERIALGLVDKLVKPIALQAAPDVISIRETVMFEVVRK
jgi:hypothetical protein